MNDDQKPSYAEIVSTYFTSPDKSFSITVPEVDHALQHYDEMVAATWRMENPAAARNGLMAACLAHAMGWTAEIGLEQLNTNEHFRTLIEVSQDVYKDCKVAGLFQSDKANLS
jgi:hypothetical protein